MTVKGAVRPEIPIARDELQFWRIVNAAADIYADIQIDGQPLEIIALDGMPETTTTRRYKGHRSSYGLQPAPDVLVERRRQALDSARER